MLTCCVCSRLPADEPKRRLQDSASEKQVQKYRTGLGKMLMHFQEIQATGSYFRKKNSRFLSQFQIALPSNKRTFTQNKSRHVTCHMYMTN
jgi:hypothetical protein